MKRGAIISNDGLYRYDLTRTVEAGCNCLRCYGGQPRKHDGLVLWILCNPSTADASVDDPTERRGWNFTDSWGYGRMAFVNTNPVRSTDPELAHVPPTIALVNNELIITAYARAAALIVCAWGTKANPALAANTLRVLQKEAKDKLHVLGLTRDGVPRHPLYMSGDTKPKAWKPTWNTTPQFPSQVSH